MGIIFYKSGTAFRWKIHLTLKGLSVSRNQVMGRSKVHCRSLCARPEQ